MKRRMTTILGIAIAVSMTRGVFASTQEWCAGQNPMPPTNLEAVDTPNDAGNAVDLTWSLSLSDIFNPSNAAGSKTDPELSSTSSTRAFDPEPRTCGSDGKDFTVPSTPKYGSRMILRVFPISKYPPS